MTDESVEIPETTNGLRAQLTQANDRLIQAELRHHATQAGIIDLEGLKLLDTSAIKLDDDGNVPEASAAVERLKRDKPWLFAKPNSSQPALAPAAEPPKKRSAKDMTHKEWQAAREKLLRGR